MAKRISRKVAALKRRLLEAMVDRAEVDQAANRYRPDYICAWWVGILNTQRMQNPELPEVTDPQVRRCLVMLLDEEKVARSGHGHHRWRGITIAEKLEKAEKERQGQEREVLLERLRGLGIATYTTYSGGFVIEQDTATALAEMLEDFPGIVEQYFVTDEPDDEQIKR